MLSGEINSTKYKTESRVNKFNIYLIANSLKWILLMSPRAHGIWLSWSNIASLREMNVLAINFIFTLSLSRKQALSDIHNHNASYPFVLSVSIPRWWRGGSVWQHSERWSAIPQVSLPRVSLYHSKGKCASPSPSLFHSILILAEDCRTGLWYLLTWNTESCQFPKRSVGGFCKHA